MKVHFLTENALEALRANFHNNLKNYKKENNEWIYDYFRPEEPFIEFKTEFDDFELITSEVDEESADVQNVVSLYSAMRSLTDTQATDERLWAGMCHSDFWDFLHHRWRMGENTTISESAIKSRFFFAQNKKRSLVTNTLSKLWWIGRLTYDEQRSDPFELTKYLSSDFATKSLVIFSSNYMANRDVAIGLLSALMDLEKEGFVLIGHTKRDIYYEATKYLNVLGGTYILDYFSSNEIREKVMNYLLSLNSYSV